MRPVREIGDELYAMPPDTFTAARDGYVTEAKTAGDRHVAAELGRMKRPGLAAWLVNLVALRRPDSVRRLIELGETVREAQMSMTRGSSTPTQLRDLSAQRRKAIDTILAQARSLAAELGRAGPTKQQLTEIEATLAAAMADESAAALVRSGRVLKALSYSGFGQALPGAEVGRTAVAGTAGRGAGASVVTRPRTGRGRDPEVDDEARRATQARLAGAQTRLDDTRRVLAEAARLEQASNDETDRLAAEIAALRERLDGAQRDARAARQARLAAERDLASAQRRLRSHSPPERAEP